MSKTPPVQTADPTPESPEERTHRIRRGDLIISPLMIAGSCWFAYDSYEMSRIAIETGNATIPTSPGLMPFLISVLIAICSVRVFVIALRSGADLSFLRLESLRPHFAQREHWTAPIVMGLFATYVFVLIGHIPFLAATIAYGIAMMVFFKATRWIWILTINVVYAVFVVFCFSEFAFTNFPHPWPF